MKSEENRERMIFEEALEIESSEARDAYLSEACADDADLFDRVQTLLQATEQAAEFFATEPESPFASLTEGPGTNIGRYKILEVIGEGGMGIVYMAEQEKPVRRRVALKIIKLGMDTKQVVARFEAERQALALMDHPNIAKVLDAGSTETGRPYFVMELIRGLPVTQFCKERKLTVEQRLELFIQICGAVQHAHQKGLIHRDLKPSNILVSSQTNETVPKIIDFGIAKAIQQRLTEKTLCTRFHHFIGTPEYMSPEQADMSGLDVDTRSDIYSLGVLLYELVTGTTPLSGADLRTLDYEEMLQRIKDSEPEKPSTRIAKSRYRKASVQRKELAPESSTLASDLDWIVIKALEKDCSRRYQSASGFADDLRRFLRHEPVQAVAPSVFYTLSKFVRRNRVVVASVVLISVLMVSGVAFMLQATRAERQARNEAAVAQAIRDFLTELLRSGSAWQGPRPDRSIGDVVQLAAENVNLQDHPLVEGYLRLVVGQALPFGSPEQRQQLRFAFEILETELGPSHRSTIEAMTELGWSLNLEKDREESELLLRTAYETSRRHLDDSDPIRLRAMWALGQHHINHGNWAEATELIPQGLELSRKAAGGKANLGAFLFSMPILRESEGRVAEAHSYRRAYLDYERDLHGADSIPFANGLWLFADSQSYYHGHHEEAAALLKQALGISQDLLGSAYPTGHIVNRLALVRLRQGDYQEAYRIQREFVVGREPNHDWSSEDWDWPWRVIECPALIGDWETVVRDAKSLHERGALDGRGLTLCLLASRLAGKTNGVPGLWQDLWRYCSVHPQEAALYPTALMALVMPTPDGELPRVTDLSEHVIRKRQPERAPFVARIPQFAFNARIPPYLVELLQGLKAYRQGRWKVAEEHLLPLRGKTESGWKPAEWTLPPCRNNYGDYAAAALSSYFVGMAQHRQRREEEARDTLQKANERLNALLLPGVLSTQGHSLNVHLVAALAARLEAETLISPSEISPVVTVESLQISRMNWNEVDQLIRKVAQAGRRQEFRKAAQLYRQAVNHPAFDMRAAFEHYDWLARKWSWTLAISEDWEDCLNIAGQTDDFMILVSLPPNKIPPEVAKRRDKSWVLEQLQAEWKAGDKLDRWDRLALGMWQYRAERFEDALEVLAGTMEDPQVYVSLVSRVYAAMAMQSSKSNDSPQAHRWLSEAQQGLDQLVEAADGFLEPNWQNPALLKLSIAEAKGLLMQQP